MIIRKSVLIKLFFCLKGIFVSAQWQRLGLINLKIKTAPCKGSLAYKLVLATPILCIQPAKSWFYHFPYPLDGVEISRAFSPKYKIRSLCG